MPTKTRLRLERISGRSIAAVRRQESQTLVVEKTLREEIVDEANALRKHLHEPHEAFGASFIHLFNKDLVDFVRIKGDACVAVEWPHQATHRLVPTSWNDNTLPRNAPDLFALSVCAEPLHRRLHRTALKVKRGLPEGAPVYRKAGPLSGKRGVLHYMLKATSASISPGIVFKMKSEELDILYHTLINAINLKNHSK